MYGRSKGLLPSNVTRVPSELLRQPGGIFGLAAAAITFGIGKLVGVSIN